MSLEETERREMEDIGGEEAAEEATEDETPREKEFLITSETDVSAGTWVDVVGAGLEPPGGVPHGKVEICAMEELGEIRQWFLYYKRKNYDKRVDEATRRYIHDGIMPILYAKLMQKDRWFRIGRMKIQAKEGDIVKFKPNKMQREVLAAIKQQEKDEGKVRLLVQKARQTGISTICTAVIFDRHIMEPHLNAMIISHRKSSAEWISRIYKRFYRYCGQSEATKPKANMTKESVEYLVKDGGNIVIVAARFADAALSQTRQLALFDEVAFWPDFDTYSAAMPQIPKKPRTMLMVISTPYGLGSGFHKFWNQKNDGFARVFLPWYDMDEYQMEMKDELEREKLWDDLNKHKEIFGDEKAEMARYKLNIERIKWRRYTITTECQSNPDQFKMWYPANDQEGFLGGGRKFFNFSLGDNWASAMQYRGKNYDVVFERDKGNRIVDAHLEEQEQGRLRMLVRPKRGRKYIIGVDAAGGKIVDEKRREPDRSVAWVLDRGDVATMEPMKQVAKWKGHIEPDLLGWIVTALIKHYNNAWAAIESNNHGLAVINSTSVKCRSRIVERPDNKPNAKLDITKSPKARELGIHTNVFTRGLILDELKRALRDGYLITTDTEFLEECDTFIHANDGRPEAQEGCHDDEIFATALAVAAHTMKWVAGAKVEDEKVIEAQEKIDELMKYVRLKPGQAHGDYVVSKPTI